VRKSRWVSWVGEALSGSGTSCGVLVSGKGKWAVAGYSQVQWQDMQLNLMSRK